MILAIVIVLMIISGTAKAVKDKVSFHYGGSVFVGRNAYFWNPDVSWKNKWKGGMKSFGPKFFGSTTFLVWTTDAWHLFGMINGLSFATAFLLIGMYLPFWYAFIAYAFARGVFELMFKYIFEKR